MEIGDVMNIYYITDNEIRKLCNERILRRGYDYYYRSKIDDIYWDDEDRFFYTVVYGSMKHRVYIYVNESGDCTDFHCTCPAYSDFDGICKHIVAALLELKTFDEKELIRMVRPEKQSVNRHPLSLATNNNTEYNTSPRVDFLEKKNLMELIQSFQQMYLKKQETYHERERLSVEYIVKLFPKLYSFRFPSIEVELRVGAKRLYVVKDIKEFLIAVHHGKTLRFTKLFTYDPADYIFSDEDAAILGWLWEIIQLQDDVSPFSNFTYSTTSRDEKRSLKIPAPLLKQFLEMVQNKNVVIHLNDFTFKEFQFVNGTLPLQFTIEPSLDYPGHFYFKWENEEDIAFFGEEYGVIFFDGTFYELEEGQSEAIEYLIRHLTKYSPAELTITNDQLENFASLVLPQLKKLGNVHINEKVREKIHLAPLKGKLYVDYDDEKLTAELIFQYGEEKFSPFDSTKRYNGRVTVRDIEKEYLLLSYVERVPFKYNGKELYLDDLEDIIQFVTEDLPEISQHFEVYATSMVKSLVYEPVDMPSVRVEANEQLNLLDIQFEFDGISDDEMSALLQALLENKKYYRLTSGSFVNLEKEEFQHMKGMIEELDIGKKEIEPKTSVPMLKAFQVAENEAFNIKKGKAFRHLIDRILNPEEVEFQIPEELSGVLRDYQKTGFRWLKSLAHYGFGGILADDMGLGKTLQIITYLLSLKKEGELGTTLIICPSSLVYNWQKEIERFAPMLSTAVISGSIVERKETFAEAKDKDVWITSYPLIRRDIEAYVDKTFSTLILDEAQYVKNDWTKTARAVKMIKAKHAFALSGTPIENSLNELYSITEIVLPGLFKNKTAFKAMDQESIAKRIKPFVLRRLKRDVLTELPEKIETVQYTELSEEQKKLYVAQLHLIRNDAKDAIEASAFQENRMKILAGITRLRQICCHPALFIENYEGTSGKMERLFEYLEEAMENDRRIVIFSQFTKMLRIIRDRLYEYGWSYHYLDGSTPAAERVELAERFNNGEKQLFLISLRAGGTGLNLTGGDTVILFDSWWNPAVEEQAADRVYRFGQKKVVQVTKLITTGTIEEKIHRLQEEKRELLDRVIQPGETMITSLTKEDIEEILDL